MVETCMKRVEGVDIGGVPFFVWLRRLYDTIDSRINVNSIHLKKQTDIIAEYQTVMPLMYSCFERFMAVETVVHPEELSGVTPARVVDMSKEYDLTDVNGVRDSVLITAMTVINFSTIYKPQGFTDVIEKTFDKEVLWQLLDKYFEEKPKTVEAQVSLTGDEDLLADALHDLKDAEKNLRQAYKEQNWHKAFKICHSVKGISSVINASSLNSLAKDLEQKFKEGTDVGERAVSMLCSELNKVVTKLSPNKPAVSSESRELLETVQKLLELDDMSAINYIKLLQKMPNTETLIQHLNNYDLLSARTENELLLRKM